MIILFDVNETLLDISELKTKWIAHTNEDLSKYFFAKLLHTSTIIGSIGDYVDFATLSQNVVRSILCEVDKNQSDAVISDILSVFKNPVPHTDVVQALQLLQRKDIKLIAVSNSSQAMLEAQLRTAKIHEYFSNLYSVDVVKSYKPFPAIYNFVKDDQNLSADEIYMVACHDWDLHGAKNVGFKTAYIKRNNSIFNPNYPLPDLQANNLVELAQCIIDNL